VVSSQILVVRRQQVLQIRNPQSEIRNPNVVRCPWSVVAAIGFIQRFTWNGKILWFFMPYDWSGFAPEISEVRASGPFINPDHFANYLAAILPLALGLVIYSRHLFSKESQLAAKIFFGLTAFVAFTSLLLSLSRSGWMSAILGIALLFWLFPRRAEEKSQPHRATKEILVRRGSLLAVAILLIVSLFFIGPGGREQVDSRLHETVTQETGIGSRVGLWRGTFRMIQDFPILGVGLGAWPDLFPRYRSAPWTPIFYREAHNDYAELLADTGVIGFVLLLLFFSLAAKRVLSYLRLSSDKPGSKALGAMLLAALGAMTFHEFFDFNLQIPANALLFTVLLAIGVRIASNMHSAKSKAPSAEVSSMPHAPRSMLFRLASRLALSSLPFATWPLALCVLCAFLILAAFTQEMIPYPYSLKMPETVAGANDMILAYPALSTPHLYLLRLTEATTPLDGQLNQLRAALWLNPTDPYIRDQYARLLLGAGEQKEGLSEVSQSVFNAPYLFAHYYLSGRLLPWLSTKEKNAVENGFKKANARDFPDAMTNLATFYEATKRYAEQGRLFEAAAGRAGEAARKANLFVQAGSSYAQAGDEGRTEMLLRKAAALAPEDPRPYQMLATMVYGPQKQVANISKTIADGIKNGAPAFALYLASAEAAQKAGALDQSKKALSMAKEALRTESQEGQEPLRPYYALAEAAQRLGFPDEATSALLQALEFRPSSTETLLRLANLYLQDGNFDRAAYYFRSYVEINPAAADAFYHLGVAEEHQYRFAAAEDAYKRAVELAPQHYAYRKGYENLKARLVQNTQPDR
jgi:O-antigen ligase/tetratricopeptide (TPR) repeat protein